jgi:hypothetical protein
MILRRRNIPYIAAFVVLFAFFGWILSKMAAQTHGRTLAYMLAAMAVSLIVLGVSARLFMGRVTCPECGKKTERGEGACKHCGADLAKAT